MIKAICPGSFDPVTNGHLDIIERAAALFDEVVVVAMTNYKKQGKYAFTAEERAELLKKVTEGMPNVTVDTYDGLLADYCREHDIKVVVKGLRALSDFDSEFQQALGNRHLNPDLETVFIATRAENMFLNSSLVRQIGELGGDISDFVPGVVLEDITNHLRKD
ncbi:MAG: pantetheine-phosphate adenylyltransferase [Clostridia bacterium]|nr:pantetheine-phosphate adenylyltransferase [Clostridia bacterium]MBQ1895620.1 pantetheine-phosphate adenylyltransferase [Clostridia bacterium]MBQ2091686.1 pantetheine-phosphate adenylyltransferase [Clostridia bacterium]MBQ2499928.1 pantetheine-phosphate adenylyltransferase [Clostridia bacterium]MBQ3897715.1 pantetheine-phosphate adenylyltransferase [Clostridia bacterium]